MKKLHLATGNDSLRQTMQHIQVKNGFCYATDAHILVKVPINEVFGGVITQEDEIYILSKDWKDQKMYKAAYIFKSNNILTAFDKKMVKLGMLEFMSKETFEDKIGRFPNCESILPEDDKPVVDLGKISFNPSLYSRICEALEDSCQLFNLTFFGPNRCILVKHNKQDEFTKGFGMMMPIIIN
jgi:hypothetical protein